MCNRGDTVPVYVRIPADLSHSGAVRWKETQIDRCIAPLVRALQVEGIHMRGSCCGHGKRRFRWWPWKKADGYIDLQDGRCLVIKADGQDYMAGLKVPGGCGGEKP